ncbi:MAG: SAM-dependent methyltransferase [Chloroflexi bacterium]|nr:SAM-dependent methyltransferase [Chloroflexota bacterium]
MPLERTAIRERLRRFDFRNLFVEELGWDIHHGRLDVSVDGRSYALDAVAEKHGLAVYLCQSADGLPDAATRRKIEREAAKRTHEKLIVFTDQARTAQVWQWVKKEPGRPAAFREQAFKAGQAEELLVQKLDAIAFDIQEAERITSVAEVAARVGASFDVDRVTKRFYERFKAEHQAFLSFVEGIAVVADREWYASLMLNRLMFIYFFQKKGFLDDDPSYLRTRLKMVQQQRGAGQFHSFYRYFLTRLFHEGLGAPEKERDASLEPLIGRVPYLNGGLFDEHQLERTYPGIDIPDPVFERVFEFFDAYDWHLDDRPVGKDNEINPDVLGYIFEKYVNQKQMGAYYTKEDITEYIAKNTIVPFLFDAAEKKCAVAFRPDGALWRLLREDPDRYIYEAVRRGVDLPLPAEIEAGVADVSRRGGWNRPASADRALPTETWREHAARRQRCHEIRTKLRAGEVHAIDDLVTLNLDLRRFAQDVIETAEGPELVRAFWLALAGRIPEQSNETWEQGISVLDPTCGSGAFLFAALNVLLPLYEACLQRMQRFVDEADLADPEHGARKYPDFRRTLKRMAQHHNPRYFMLKSIVLENLYGVDIMEEAVEICKLRLFLKLVAQLDSADQVEPLPDIDFNIRAGNTLVGFATRDQVRQALTVTGGGQLKMTTSTEDEDLERIDELAEVADRAFKEFRRQQTTYGGSVTAADKSALRSRLQTLDAELDRLLARQYGIQPERRADFERWRQSHQPFHWFVQFYGIIAGGGFDAIIGNPPYIARSKVEKAYRLRDYRTQNCPDIYALVLERVAALKGPVGRTGMIVPLSITFSSDFASLRNLLFSTYSKNWFSSYGRIPSALFNFDVRVRNTIHIGRSGESTSCNYTTRTHRWYGEERRHLFPSLSYVAFTPDVFLKMIPKLPSQELGNLFHTWLSKSHGSMSSIISLNRTKNVLNFKKTAYNWLTFSTDVPPAMDVRGSVIPQTEFGEVHFAERHLQRLEPVQEFRHGREQGG